MAPETEPVSRRPGMRLPGWRALAVTWAAVLILAGTALGTLQALGPLPPREAGGAASHPPAVETVSATPPAEQPGPTAHADPPPAPPRSPAIAVAGPIAALLDPPGPPDTNDKALPRIAPDGRMPRTAYAAPVIPTQGAAPRIAILLSGFGLSQRESQNAIEALPGPVTLAVSTDMPPASKLLDAARLAGHELLASLPMEPDGYPQIDEGEHSLLTGHTPEENSRDLLWALARTQGAVGATGASDGMRGERFAEITADFDPILAEIARRGLLYIDSRPGRSVERTVDHPGAAIGVVDLVLDDPGSRAEIEAKLIALERIARQRGTAIGLAGPPHPAIVERLAEWSRTVGERGFVLVPVSQIVNAAAPPPTVKPPHD